ncbi:Squamosa promoter-binding-like protein [Musa troglodytarum]|uniref:Squamosa promoter-binding-like protein n=1 Tax=Musa troglodytarum TaxID=320322 RepID=A0A9E7KYN7_9LILI|nr:Squamosa promoter-binding-like protein [Musa troglodytarum]
MSSAKDYHRRHKVCEVHSNTSKALVGKRMEKSCQQCSRFHPLPEFDEGKRSCGTKDKQTSIPPLTDRDRLVQFISNLSASTEQPCGREVSFIFSPSYKEAIPSTFNVGECEICTSRGENATVELSTSHGGSALIELFEVSETQAESRVMYDMVMHLCLNILCFICHYANMTKQDRTGWIIFKLFGKDLSSFPDNLRSQILNWLSNSPSEMESYLRPGCVILSIYLRMQSIAWEAIRLSKTWRAWSSPELTSVSPVAVVCGQETSLVLKGCNLIVPGTNLILAGSIVLIWVNICKRKLFAQHIQAPYMMIPVWRGLTFQEDHQRPLVANGPRCQLTLEFHAQVENGFKGNSFPIIIADTSICQELRTLESEFEEDVQTTNVIAEEHVNSAGPRSRERTCRPSSLLSLPDFSSAQFKYLFTLNEIGAVLSKPFWIFWWREAEMLP